MNKPASDHPDVIEFPPVIPLCTLVVAGALQWLAPLGWLAGVAAIHRIPSGIFVVTAGLLVTISGRRTLVSHHTNVNPSLPTTALVTAGVFRWTRNPLYIGVLSAMLGVSLVFAIDWLALLIIPSCLIMHFAVVMREEHYLEQKFGDEFRSYKTRVPRYLIDLTMDFPLKMPRTIALQLSRPTGVLGRLIARLMNRHNAAMNAFAVEQLDPQRSDRILEIGFGGGAALKPLIDRAGFVAGIDRSDEMVRRASTLFFEAVEAGRAQFREGYVESLPFARNSFEKICTVNTVYFWDSLEAGFAEIHRVLIPGGRLVVGFLPKDRMDRMGMPTDIFAIRAPDDVVATLKATGFASVRVERPEFDTPWNVIVASR